MKVSRTLQSQNVFGSQRKTLVSPSHNNFHSAPLSLKSVNLLTCILGHNSNLEEGVMVGSFYTGYLTHINLFHTSFHVSLSHQHSTTVSFETKLSYILSWFSSVYHSIELLKLLYCKFWLSRREQNVSAEEVHRKNSLSAIIIYLWVKSRVW